MIIILALSFLSASCSGNPTPTPIDAMFIPEPFVEHWGPKAMACPLGDCQFFPFRLRNYGSGLCLHYVNSDLDMTPCDCWIHYQYSNECQLNWRYYPTLDMSIGPAWSLLGPSEAGKRIQVSSPSAGEPLGLVAGNHTEFGYSRATRLWTTSGFCIEHVLSDASNPLQVQNCDGSDAQRWFTDFVIDPFPPCRTIGDRISVCLPKEHCSNLSCGRCERCDYGYCEDITNIDECCDCIDSGMSSCTERPHGDGCVIPGDPCLANSCDATQAYSCHSGCISNTCVLPCAEGLGCYTRPGMSPPFQPTCAPNPCDDVTCWDPNMECVLIGEDTGDIVPWCQCKEDYHLYCGNECTYVEHGTIFRGHILENIEMRDRDSCCRECIANKKCGFWSHHEKLNAGHCKLFSKWGRPKKRTRIGWVSNLPYFDAENFRQSPPGPPLRLIHILAIYDAQSAWYSGFLDGWLSTKDAVDNSSATAAILVTYGNAAAPILAPYKREAEQIELLDIKEMLHAGSCKPKGGASSCDMGDKFCHCTPDCVEVGDCCQDYLHYCGNEKGT